MFSSVSLSLDRYPKDLIIRIQDGSLNTNYNRPYFLWLDDQDKKHLLAVIDIMATEDKINEYGSYLLVTKNEVIFKNALEDNKLSRINLSVIKNEIIGKQTIENVKESLLRIKGMLIILYPLALFILLVFFVMVSLVSTIMYIILASALIYVLCIFNILKLKVNFVKVFQISLHSVSLPLSINYALGALRSPTSLLPLMFLFFVTAFTLMGVNKAYTFKELNTTSPHHKKK